MSSRIEAGLTIEGSVRGEGELEVAGRVRGAVTLDGTLVVEQGGVVEADVEAVHIEVAGVLAGSATAHDSVQVLAGGRVEARVKTPRMLVDDGAYFRGELVAQTGDGPAELEPTPPSHALPPGRGPRTPRHREPEPEVAARVLPPASPQTRDARATVPERPRREGRPGEPRPPQDVRGKEPRTNEAPPRRQDARGPESRPEERVHEGRRGGNRVGVRGKPPAFAVPPRPPARSAVPPAAGAAETIASRPTEPPRMPSLPKGRSEIARRRGSS